MILVNESRGLFTCEEVDVSKFLKSNQYYKMMAYPPYGYSTFPSPSLKEWYTPIDSLLIDDRGALVKLPDIGSRTSLDVSVGTAPWYAIHATFFLPL